MNCLFFFILRSPRLIQAFVDEGITVRQITCGFAYTACVDVHNEMYAWGAGENGRLGTGTTQDRLVPTRVSVRETALLEIPVRFKNQIVESYVIVSLYTSCIYRYTYFFIRSIL